LSKVKPEVRSYLKELVDKFLTESNCLSLWDDTEYTEPCIEFGDWLIKKGLLKDEARVKEEAEEEAHAGECDCWRQEGHDN